MLPAGTLTEQIVIERQTETVAPSGAVSKSWAPWVQVRAQLVEQSAEEYLAGFGETDGGKALFRIRYLSGLLLSDRILFRGERYDIDAITEPERGRSLELRVTKQ
ncbi:MAG: phage head closure protein [Roseivivax sp.]|nr:phage head closure protein [Roseivivax sp.]